MKSLKLLRVIASMDPKTGGPPNGINYITPFLNELNVATTIVCLDNEGEPFFQNNATNIICLDQNKTAWQYNDKLYNWLITNLIFYDVVIVHGIWIYHTYAVSKAVKKVRLKNQDFKIKYFIYPHGMLDSYFQKTRKRVLKSIRNYFYWHLIESKNIAQADGIIFTSQSEMEIAATTFSNYIPKQTLNLGYGVDVPKFIIKQKTPDEYFVFLGRYDHKKGIDTLINAYKFLLIEKKVKLPKLIIAGPGLNESYGQFIQNLVNTNSILKENIELKNMVSGDEKWKLLSNAKALILWSHQENFGITVAESLGMGVPVILSKQVNIWKEIVANHAGLSNDDSEKNLISTIENFCALSEKDYKNMCLNARKTYEDLYTPKLYAKRLQSLFENNK